MCLYYDVMYLLMVHHAYSDGEPGGTVRQWDCKTVGQCDCKTVGLHTVMESLVGR